MIYYVLTFIAGTAFGAVGILLLQILNYWGSLQHKEKP